VVCFRRTESFSKAHLYCSAPATAAFTHGLNPPASFALSPLLNFLPLCIGSQRRGRRRRCLDLTLMRGVDGEIGEELVAQSLQLRVAGYSLHLPLWEEGGRRARLYGLFTLSPSLSSRGVAYAACHINVIVNLMAVGAGESCGGALTFPAFSRISLDFWTLLITFLANVHSSSLPHCCPVLSATWKPARRRGCQSGTARNETNWRKPIMGATLFLCFENE
jgi:hypothetical protein